MAVTEANIVANAMHGLATNMVESLVDDSSAVMIGVDWRHGCLVMSVGVAKVDVGKIIGKSGRTARSLRTILGGAARRWGVVCELSIGCSEAGGDAQRD